MTRMSLQAIAGVMLGAIAVALGVRGIGGGGGYCGTVFAPASPGRSSAGLLVTDCSAFRAIPDTLVWGLLGIGLLLIVPAVVHGVTAFGHRAPNPPCV